MWFVDLLIKLAIPLLLTIILIYCLRKLDARWQAEAPAPQLEMEKSECWQIKNCPPDQFINCPAANSPAPCWEVFRDADGDLQAACRACEVFQQDHAPTLKTESRRL